MSRPELAADRCVVEPVHATGVARPEVLNFAVIGCGMMARGQHIPNLAHSRKTRLHTCIDLDEKVLAELRGHYHGVKTGRDYRAAIADPDVQAICLAATEKLRLPVIEAAAKAGKPVYVEKPLARTLAEAYEIQKVVRQAGIPFCIGHNRRCSPAMLEAHRIFRRHMEHPASCPWRFDRNPGARPHPADDGVAGMSVRINDDWYSWKEWVFDREQAPHGAMLFEMTHFTDVCNWFLAAQPESVMALSHEPFNHGVVIRYPTGELATISMSANGTFGYPKELYECFGNGGAVIIDHMVEIRTAGIADAPARQTYPLTHDRHPTIGTEGGIPGWLAKKRIACQEAAAAGDANLIFTAEADKGHAAMLDRFVDEIRGRGPRVCGVDDAILATRVAFAAIKSAQEKRLVRLEEIEMNKDSPLLARAEEINPAMKAYYADRRLMWRNLAMIMVLNLGWGLCLNVVLPLMQLRLSGLGMNSIELGWLYGCTSWVTGFLTMYFAWKSDHTVTRWGRRIPYLFLSAPFVILTVVLFPLFNSVWVLLVIWAVGAVARDAEGATIPLLNIDCMPRRLLARLGAPMSILFGIVGFVALRYGLGLPGGWPYFIGGAVALATTFAGLGIREPPVHAEGRQERFKPWSAMQVAFEDRRTILLVVSAALVYSFFVIWNMWIFLYAQNTLHLSKPEIGAVMAWPLLISIVIAWPAAWLIDHFSPYKLAAVFWLLCGLLVVFLWHARTSLGLALVVCAGALVAPLYSAVDIMVYRHRHPNEVGSVTSSLSFVKFGLCAGLAQGLSGNLIQALHNNYVFGDVLGWLLMSAGLAGLFIYRRLMRPRQPITAPVPALMEGGA